MAIRFRGWYHPFDSGWKLCSYQTKSQGYDDLSHRLHEFKENDQTAVEAFTGWSVDFLEDLLPELEIDYCIRSLGRHELHPNPAKPLHRLASEIADHFGIDFVPELIGKTRTTRHLVGLNKAQREDELDGVFYIHTDHDLDNSSVLIVDDIRTSGTTTNYLRNTIIEQFNDVKCYLFVLAQTNDGENSQEIIDSYSNYV